METIKMEKIKKDKTVHRITSYRITKSSLSIFIVSGTLAVFMSLSGCSSYQDQFDCPAGTGVGCKSVSEVNALIDKGAFKKGTFKKRAFDQKASSDRMTEEEDEIKLISLKEVEPRLISLDPERLDPRSPVVRVPEQTMEVWIRGYGDKEGHYHHDSHIHMVVRPARWHMNPKTAS